MESQKQNCHAVTVTRVCINDGNGFELEAQKSICFLFAVKVLEQAASSGWQGGDTGH